jgi:hypothetical protein
MQEKQAVTREYKPLYLKATKKAFVGFARRIHLADRVSLKIRYPARSYLNRSGKPWSIWKGSR